MDAWFRLPLKATNEITVTVMASSGANLLFYDKDPTSDSSEYKVLVTLGSDGNTTASIGLKSENSKYNTELVTAKNILSGSHFKTFTVRWAKGRVMLFHHGFEKPLIVWDGPKEIGFTNVGVRTVGCAGEWRVQGLPNIKTPDSKEYHDVEINTGRMDFELMAGHDCGFCLAPDMKFGDHVIAFIGAWNNARSAIFKGGEIGYNRGDRTQGAGILSENEYRKFWVKWDATNIFFGRAGSNVPDAGALNMGTPFKTFKFFGLRSNTPSHGDWHIFNTVGKYDVPEGGETQDDVGYLVYSVETQVAQ